jgi:hypothetical protein
VTLWGNDRLPHATECQSCVSKCYHQIACSLWKQGQAPASHQSSETNNTLLEILVPKTEPQELYAALTLTYTYVPAATQQELAIPAIFAGQYSP